MENDLNKNEQQKEVRKGTSIHSLKPEHRQGNTEAFKQKKTKKSIPHHPEKDHSKNNDDESSSRIKPFINMYDPFG